MMRQLALELARAPEPVFDNFAPGRNREAKARLEDLAAGRSDEHFVYLWGTAGSGRTHLLRAAHAAMAAAGRASVYVACEDRMAGLPATGSLACLLVDDVQRLPADGQVALFNAYNALRETGGALVAAGDAPAVQLPLRPDVVTRLGWGLVYQLHPLSEEEKVQALGDYARQLGFTLPEGVATYLLQHVARDMGSLMGALAALDRHSLEAKRPVTLALVRELVRARTTD